MKLVHIIVLVGMLGLIIYLVTKPVKKEVKEEKIEIVEDEKIELKDEKIEIVEVETVKDVKIEPKSFESPKATRIGIGWDIFNNKAPGKSPSPQTKLARALKKGPSIPTPREILNIQLFGNPNTPPEY